MLRGAFCVSACCEAKRLLLRIPNTPGAVCEARRKLPVSAPLACPDKRFIRVAWYSESQTAVTAPGRYSVPYPRLQCVCVCVRVWVRVRVCACVRACVCE